MILALLFACTADKSATDDSSSSTLTDDTAVNTDDTGTPGTTGPAPQTTALLTTVANDYSVGALASFDLGTLAISDELTAATSDSYVKVDDGVAIIINSYGTNSIRLYTPGDWSAPTLEFSTGARSNPHDAAISRASGPCPSTGPASDENLRSRSASVSGRCSDPIACST